MANIVKSRSTLAKSTPSATRVLIDYGYWLNRHYGRLGNYQTNAKTFLKTVKSGGTVNSQLEIYSEGKSLTMQSILRRFGRFLEEKGILLITNDLHEKPLPRSNIYVKIYLLHHKDRLRGDKSSAIYATILSQYFRLIREDVRFFNKKTAEKFIHSPNLSDFTKRLYKSVLKNFSEWALKYQDIPEKDLNTDQRKVKKGLKGISAQSLREIIDIRVPNGRNQSKSYHKDSLTEKQRERLLKMSRSAIERSVLSLMAWNGFRKIEIIRLSVHDCDFKGKRIAVWGKGRSNRNKDVIKFFRVPRHEVAAYLKETKIKTGRVFPNLTIQGIEELVADKFEKMKLNKKGTKYSPHSLRHTTGQILYDNGVPLEFVQKTLRHAVMQTSMVYTQKAIDRQYFKRMID
jgi:integrase/recombinase XerC